MKPSEQQKYKDALLELRSRLTAEVSHMIEAVADELQPPGELSNVPRHNADHATEALAADVAVIQNEQQLHDEVNAALARIEAGTFGRCTQCGQPIAAARLDAIPYTSRCTECARQSERA
jgi:RNA polymerase-binding protein DksA